MAAPKQAMVHEDEEGKTWTVARPPTPFVDETGESKGWNELLDHHEWSFRAQQRKPLPSDEIASFARHVHNPPGVPLPEIVFGRNYLQLLLPKVGVDVSFNAVDALQNWNRHQHDHCINTYKGTFNVNSTLKRNLMRQLKLIEAPNFMNMMPTRKQLPVEQLKKRGHIFFYDEVPLFEDSLGGRGISKMFVKLRVMDDCFLVLLRHFVRVDGKFVKLTDTRVFHSFDEPTIYIDTEVRESSILELAKRAESHRPFSASVADKAKRDERFYMKPEQIYEILEPSRCKRFIMGTELA